MKARLAVGAVAVVAAIVFTVSTTRADLPDVPAHRHYVSTPSGGFVEVGPRLCDNPNLQRAFNEFHYNVHRAPAGGIHPAAPGLHNFQGADLSVGGCQP